MKEHNASSVPLLTTRVLGLAGVSVQRPWPGPLTRQHGSSSTKQLLASLLVSAWDSGFKFKSQAAEILLAFCFCFKFKLCLSKPIVGTLVQSYGPWEVGGLPRISVPGPGTIIRSLFATTVASLCCFWSAQGHRGRSRGYPGCSHWLLLQRQAFTM